MPSCPDKAAFELNVLYWQLRQQSMQKQLTERFHLSQLVLMQQFAADIMKRLHSDLSFVRPGIFVRAFFLTGSKRGVNRFSKTEARSSGGERYLDTVEVVGSNPIVPTSKFKRLWFIPKPLFCCLLPFCYQMFQKWYFSTFKRYVWLSFHLLFLGMTYKVV